MTLPFETRLTDALRIALPLETRFDPARAAIGLVQGYASTFGGPPDAFGSIVAPGAFRNSLVKHKHENSTPAMFWSHNPEKPIGKWLDVREDEKGLLVEGKIELGTQRGREALSLLKSGSVTGLSIGFAVPRGGRKSNGDGTETFTEIELWEVSLVAMPANSRARVTDVRSIDSLRSFESFLREAGFPRSASETIATKGWPGMMPKGEAEQLEELANSIRAGTQLIQTQKDTFKWTSRH